MTKTIRSLMFVIIIEAFCSPRVAAQPLPQRRLPRLLRQLRLCQSLLLQNLLQNQLPLLLKMQWQCMHLMPRPATSSLQDHPPSSLSMSA